MPAGTGGMEFLEGTGLTAFPAQIFLMTANQRLGTRHCVSANENFDRKSKRAERKGYRG